MRYGDTVFLDAMYKTSRWAVPLFVLAVRTNSGYQPVSLFICEDETAESIHDAISVPRENCPSWNPTHYMTDFDESEMKAMRQHFKGLSYASS